MSRYPKLIVSVVVALLLILLFGGFWYGYNHGYFIPDSLAASSSAPGTDSTSAPGSSSAVDSASAEDNFVAGGLPDCFAVNGPWLKAFAKGQTYEIDPTDPIFDQKSFNYFEGVILPSSPKDLHSVFELKDKFVAQQGNIWTCGEVSDLKVKHTILFQSADKKWQNLDQQGLAHPMKVTTPLGTWDYASGEKPAWALSMDDTNLVCPFTKASMQNPAGVIQSDGTFVGAPGKAGCDFVAIYPNGSAIRYHDAHDNFPYPDGTRFFLFDKKMTNEEVAKALNLAVVTNSK